MAADTPTDSEEEVSSTSGVTTVNSTVMETMVQSVSKFEGKVECNMVSTYHDLKSWKILKPAERARFQSICKEKSRKLRDCCKPEGCVPASACESTTQCVGTEVQKAEANGLHLSSVDDSDSEVSSEGSPRPEGFSVEPIPSISNAEYHVLAVDDNMVDRKVIERLLKISSYQVTTVNSALQALEYLGLSDSSSTSIKPNNVSVDLIITDYCMPGMTGYELLKIVKAGTSAFKNIPVIIMSSEDDSNRIKSCLAEGAKEFIIKPVQMKDVKRLQGHIMTSASSSESNESSISSSCAKRKAPDGLQANSPVRRTRYGGVAVVS